MRILTAYFLLITTLIGCTALEETSRRSMDTGIYRVSTEKKKLFYVVVAEDSIQLYKLTKVNRQWVADTATGSIIHLNATTPYSLKTRFSTSSFDLDLMTILFKYRPFTAGFPNQLNTNFNAAEFVGYRTDYYILSYDKEPLNKFRSSINHFAFSFGGFVGLGATSMNPFVTNINIQAEYDGVLITKGIAGLIGVGNFTFGAGVGFDNLLDKNHRTWIYENKPWIGFNIGLNIN